MSADITIRKVEITELEDPLAFAKKTFFDAFEAINNPNDFKIYTDQAFTLQKLELELNNPDSIFYFAMDGEDIAGYTKLNFGQAQTEFRDADGLEVERIYVDQSRQNKQIGKQLLNFAIDIGRQAGCKYIWLGVWESNARAINFYQRCGFKKFSSHYFMLGNDKQSDILMRMELA